MKNLPDLKVFVPESPEVRNYIDYYYFLNEKKEKSYFEFWHYPHYQTSLVFFKKAEFKVDNNVRYIIPADEDNLKCIFNNNLICAKKEIVMGVFNSIGIVFHPLGAKHFQDAILKGPEYFSELGFNEVFRLSDNLNPISKLDEFFKQLYQDFDAPTIEKAVEIILNRKGNINLSELSELLNVSRRTILRNFRSYLNCSFQDFKKVVKFRKAIEHNNQKKLLGKLSDLAYDLNYYDQSDLIKAFKSMTNETPKRMLTAISPLSNKLIWKHTTD